MTKIEPVTAESQQAVAEFLAAFAGEKRDAAYWRERFRLWWDLNPAFEPGSARGWILRDGERIGGFLGDIPFFFKTPGGVVKAHTATTWRVEEAFRKKSVSLYMKQLAQGQGSLLFNTTPNDAVASVLGALGFTRYPSPATGRNTLVVITGQGLGATGQAVRLAQLPMRLAAEAAEKLEAVGLLGRAEPVRGEVRELGRAGPEFDALWERTREQVAFTSVREARVIDWYCFAGARFRKRLFGYFEGSRLRGYAIAFSTRWRDTSVFECLDLWTEAGPVRRLAVRALTRAASRAAREGGHGLFVLPQFSEDLALAFTPLGMPFSRASRRGHYVKAGSDGVALPGAGESYFTSLEGDLAL